MDTTQVALLALGVGALIGAFVSVLIMWAVSVRDQAVVDLSLDVPEGTQAVLAGMDDAAVVVDGSFTVLAASEAALAFGMKDGYLLPSEELRALVRAARASEHAQSETMQLRKGVGPSAARLVVARARVIAPRLTLIVVRDITERERLEEMRRDFVSNTSHELKTPVGAVSLLAEAIESAADDPDQVRHFASRLGAEATRLGQLTSRIMSLSRLQSTDELSNLRDVSVDEVVTTAIEAHAIAAEGAGIALVRGGARGLYVRGDAQVLSDAVGNLVANAIAYSPSGGDVGLGVRLEGDAVEISVTDRGIGIPEAEQQRIFERFYRADQARSRRTGGTGLGLSIVKHAVQRHGGEIDVWSRPGRGSTFTIRLPAVAGPGDAGVTGKKNRPKQKKSKKKSSVRADEVRTKGAKKK